MKLIKKLNLTFLTPCFCAGADQRIAEIRPSAIRGELRWWFRCLGGTKEQEASVFGAAAGSGRASSILVRISKIKLSEDYHSPTFISPNDRTSYHHYFLTAPSDNLNGHTRMWEVPPEQDSKQIGKIRKESQIPKNSSFELSIYQLRKFRPMDGESPDELFEKALECFRLLGSIGYRKTRGFGAWTDEEILPRTEFESFLKRLEEFQISYEMGNGGATPDMAFNQIEGKLKGDKEKGTGLRLKERYPASKPSPLGFSIDKRRQSSAVVFRPCAVKTKKGDVQYALLIFQAPDMVLGDYARNGETRIIPIK
jgi:CRISPR type III-B/RAMP module RAMP protein Cmr1